jgi:hypothetical protein
MEESAKPANDWAEIFEKHQEEWKNKKLADLFEQLEWGSWAPSALDDWVTSSSGTENRAKVFSFLNTWSDFLTVAVIPALLATPPAALGDSVSSASVAARPTRGDDVLEDHGGSILCPRGGHSAPG